MEVLLFVFSFALNVYLFFCVCVSARVCANLCSVIGIVSFYALFWLHQGIVFHVHRVCSYVRCSVSLFCDVIP